jgi:pentatricopeptide repeat protein
VHYIIFFGCRSESISTPLTPQTPPLTEVNFAATSNTKKVNDSENTSPIQPREASTDDELARFKQAVEKNYVRDAWTMYEQLCASRFSDLEFVDHARVMSLFRESRLSHDFQKLETIFENLTRGGFLLPPAIYEAIIIRAWPQGIDKTLLYINKFKDVHGPKAMTQPMYAALMNCYRRLKKVDEGLEVFEQVRMRNGDTTHLLPIVMDLHFIQGSEEKALKVFNEYINDRSVNRLSIAKIHSWLASRYLDMGRVDDAEKIMKELTEHGCHINVSGNGVLARVALARKDYENALDLMHQEMMQSKRDTFANTTMKLQEEFQRLNRTDLLDRLVQMYCKQSKRIPTLRFSPYVSAIEYYGSKDQVAKSRQVYDMIPNSSRFRNFRLVRTMFNIYVEKGMLEKAALLLDEAERGGLDSKELRTLLAEAKSKSAPTAASRTEA